MKQKIYITYQIPEEPLEILKKSYDVLINRNEGSMTKEELKHELKDVVAVIAMYDNEFDKEVIDCLQNIKIIANFGVGYNNIDVKYAASKGIVVSNTPEVLTNATANLAFGLLLSVARRINESDKCVREGKFNGWTPTWLLGQEITGKTLGVIGAGNIGKCLAKRAKGFDMNIIYHNRNRDIDFEKEIGATYVSKDELLKTSDFVSLHVPLTKKTKYMIGLDEFKMMKDNAILINASRGKVVDEKALVKSLKKGYIWGAGLDVYENEQEVNEELLKLENVVLGAHIGGSTVDTIENMTNICARNIMQVLNGEIPPNSVN